MGEETALVLLYKVGISHKILKMRQTLREGLER